MTIASYLTSCRLPAAAPFMVLRAGLRAKALAFGFVNLTSTPQALQLAPLDAHSYERINAVPISRCSGASHDEQTLADSAELGWLFCSCANGKRALVSDKIARLEIAGEVHLGKVEMQDIHHSLVSHDVLCQLLCLASLAPLSSPAQLPLPAPHPTAWTSYSSHPKSYLKLFPVAGLWDGTHWEDLLCRCMHESSDITKPITRSPEIRNESRTGQRQKTSVTIPAGRRSVQGIDRAEATVVQPSYPSCKA